VNYYGAPNLGRGDIGHPSHEPSPEPEPTAIDLALAEIEAGLSLRDYCRRVRDNDLRQWAELLAEFGK